MVAIPAIAQRVGLSTDAVISAFVAVNGILTVIVIFETLLVMIMSYVYRTLPHQHHSPI